MKKEFIINNGKYKIVKKIGSGRFSTCWESEVLGASVDNVAIKVQRKKKDYLEMAEDEIKIYKQLCKSEAKCDNILVLKDHFTEQGGSICMVFDKMDKTLHNLIDESKTGLPIDVVKSIVKQILQGLDHLHKHGIVHTDLKPENILVKENADGSYKACISDLGNACFLKDIKRRYKLEKQSVIERFEELREEHKIMRFKELLKKEASEDELTDKDKQEIKRLEKQKEVREFKLLEKTDEVLEFKELERVVQDSIGTTEYNSVEAIIGSDYGPATDVWSVACIMFECLTNDYLFDPHSFVDSSDTSSEGSQNNDDSEYEMSDDDKEQSESESDDSDSDIDSDSDSDDEDEENQLLIDQMHLWLMTRTLGEIPKYVSRRGDYTEDFFNNAGNIKRMPQFLKEKSISYTLNYDYNIEKDEAKKIEEFMLPMLSYDSEKRINAEKALELELIESPAV